MIDHFRRGFEEVYGSAPPCMEPPPPSRYVVEHGIYMLVPPYLSHHKLKLLAYQIGKQAARSLKYNKRKSIRLGKVYKTVLIQKNADEIGGPLGLYGSYGFKATLNVSKEERREET